MDAYPNARMIHMVRDPRSLCAAHSGLTSSRPGAVGWNTARWVASMDAARDNSRRFGGRCLVIGYEDLVTDGEGIVGRVCDFLMEEVPASLNELISSIRFDVPPEVDLRPRQAGRSTARRSQSSDRFVSMHAGNLLVEHGYQNVSDQLSPTERARFTVTWPVERASMVAWRVLNSRTRR